MKFSALLVAIASVSGLAFDFPHAGTTIHRSTNKTFQVKWHHNPRVFDGESNSWRDQPDDPEYTLALCHPPPNDHTDPECESLGISMLMSKLSVTVNGYIFPKAGMYQFCAYRKNHSQFGDFPPWCGQAFNVVG